MVVITILAGVRLLQLLARAALAGMAVVVLAEGFVWLLESLLMGRGRIIPVAAVVVLGTVRIAPAMAVEVVADCATATGVTQLLEPAAYETLFHKRVSSDII